IQEGSLIGNHEFRVITDTKIKNVGQKNNSLGLSIFENSRNVTRNYDITIYEGIIQVSPRTIIIEPKYKDYIYDDVSHSSDEVNFLEGTSLVQGHSIEITTSLSGKDVGIYDVEITSMIIRDEFGEDITYNYQIGHVAGEIEIVPRPLTIRANDDIKEYDGLPLTNSGHSI